MDHHNSRRALTWALVLLFLWGQYGCLYWHRHDKRTSALPSIIKECNALFLVADHSGSDRVWRVNSPVLTNDSLRATFTLVSEITAAALLDADGSKDAKKQRNKVLIHVGRSFGTDGMKPDKAIALADVKRIESFDVDAGASVGASIACVAAVGIVLMLLIAALKSSCPFVYSQDAQGKHFEGELFSGAIYPQLQRHDRLPLAHMGEVDGAYAILLANQAKEVQSTDLLELITVDHAPGTEWLFDKYGKLHSVEHAQAPNTAIGLDGKDLGTLLNARDDSAWTGGEGLAGTDARDGLVLTFARPVSTRDAKLVITAKNSFWVDHLYGLFLDELGTYGPGIEQKSLAKPASALRQWSREQQLPLTVSIRNADGQWEIADRFELAGPMAWREDVLPLDLSKVVGDNVEIKLECGFKFWEIDRVAMDFIPDQQAHVQEVHARSATDRNGRDVLVELSAEDGTCYVQPNVGDAAWVRFDPPPQHAGTERSFFLHGAGHYHVLRDPVPITPDVFHLYGFKRPDALPKYSRERWQETAETAIAQPL